MICKIFYACTVLVRHQGIVAGHLDFIPHISCHWYYLQSHKSRDKYKHISWASHFMVPLHLCRVIYASFVLRMTWKYVSLYAVTRTLCKVYKSLKPNSYNTISSYWSLGPYCFVYIWSWDCRKQVKRCLSLCSLRLRAEKTCPSIIAELQCMFCFERYMDCATSSTIPINNSLTSFSIYELIVVQFWYDSNSSPDWVWISKL